MKPEQAKKILKKVEQDYNLMAKEWDAKQIYLPPYRVKSAQKVKDGQAVLDVGCGNGILYEYLAQKSIQYVGTDISKNLLVFAARRAKKLNAEQHQKAKYEFIQGSVTKLPFQDNCFDWVFAFAILHHVPGDELRKKAVQELYRVLKPGGRVVVTVWNLFSDYAREKFKIDSQLKEGASNDVIIPWKATKNKIVQRYLYAFTKVELRDFFKKAGFKKIDIKYAVKKTGTATPDIKLGEDLILTAIKK